ncbi:hypothetical protein [Paenibacillus xanthanilyticus]|uniref:Tail fiber protein n=1 Tax=Paenibacillus xanthanilyticus TaxID=1783531 RepID=A0ABV8KC23_9BACL
MPRFKPISKNLDLQAQADWQANFERADADLTSLQTQITAEQQARIAVDSAHASAATAHQATQIAYDGASNVKQKIDAQQAQINNLTGGGAAPNAAEVQDARLGADNVARANVGTLIREIHAKQLTAAAQTATIKRGLNNVVTDQASPLNVSVYGRTLANLLGSDGNFENSVEAAGNTSGVTLELDATSPRYGGKSLKLTLTSSTSGNSYRSISSNIAAGKYYVYLVDVKNGNSQSIRCLIETDTKMINSSYHTSTTYKTVYSKFAPADYSSSSSVHLDIVVVGTATGQYAFADGMRLYEIDAATYAKIDVDPEYTGDKLADKFPYVDGVKHLNGATLRKHGKNQVPPITEWYSIHPNVKITDEYEFTINATSDNQNSIARISVLPLAQYVFAAPITAGNYYVIAEYDAGGGWLGQFNCAAQQGFTTKATTSYIDLIAVTANAGNFTFSKPMLTLGTALVPFEPRNDDYVFLPTMLASNVDGSVRDSVYWRDGAWRKLKRWNTNVAIDGSRTWSFSNDYTSYKVVRTAKLPNQQSWMSSDIFAKYDGKKLGVVNWPLVTSDSVTVDGDGFIYISVSDAESGWGETYTPSAAEISAYFYGWRMNNGTFGTPYNGTGTKTWVRWDATSNTGSVTVTPTTIASGYTPYSLSYQLATPIEEVIVGAEGAVGLHAGGNAVELGDGVIVREKVNPVVSSTPGYYDVNLATSTGSRFANRVQQINALYRNGVLDKRWVIVTDALGFGNQRAYISTADYDSTAEYTVTYVMLDKYASTASAIEAKAEYNANPKTVIDALVRDQADTQTNVSALVRSVADLYKRMKALGG